MCDPALWSIQEWSASCAYLFFFLVSPNTFFCLGKFLFQTMAAHNRGCLADINKSSFSSVISGGYILDRRPEMRASVWHLKEAKVNSSYRCFVLLYIKYRLTHRTTDWPKNSLAVSLSRTQGSEQLWRLYLILSVLYDWRMCNCCRPDCDPVIVPTHCNRTTYFLKKHCHAVLPSLSWFSKDACAYK